jgi:hypothetical protein
MSEYVYIQNLILVLMTLCTVSCVKRKAASSIKDIDYEKLVKEKITAIEKECLGLKIENQNVFWGKDSLRLQPLRTLNLKSMS